MSDHVKVEGALLITKHENGDIKMSVDKAEDIDDWSEALLDSAINHVKGLLTRVDQENAKQTPSKIH
jgi:hypothetical protein